MADDSERAAKRLKLEQEILEAEQNESANQPENAAGPSTNGAAPSDLYLDTVSVTTFCSN